MNKPFVIAEIGSNHNQDLERALDMISMSKEAGADAAKFQSLNFEALYHPGYETKEFREWFKQIELDERWYEALDKRCRQEGIEFISAPTYSRSLALMESIGVKRYKLASPQFQSNHPLVAETAKLGKPLIISTGYSTYADIEKGVNLCLESGNRDITLLHCISMYPTRYEDANLMMIPTLQRMFGLPVGLSDHSFGDHLAVAAVALGATVIEKHVTTDRDLEGPDHAFAMTFEEFGVMTEKIHQTATAMGNGTKLSVDPVVGGYKENVQLYLFAREDIPKGVPLKGRVYFKRLNAKQPGSLTYETFEKMEGIMHCRRDIPKDSVILLHDCELA